VTVRLDKDGKGEADVADDQAEGATLKLIVRAEKDGFIVTPADAKKIRPDWRAEAAPLPDDPDKSVRVLVYRRAYAGLLQGELGDSTTSDRPVWDEIKARLPISAWFGAWSLLLAYGISIPLGVAKALKRDGWFDRGSSQVLFILYSIPGFILAVAALQFLCFQLGWFPTKGFDWESLTWGDRLHHTIVPLACEMVGAFTALTLFTRNGLLDNLAADYVRTAKAKGLGHRGRIVYVHALRNALIPLAATFGGNLGFFLTGAFLIEVTFNIPGLGLLGLPMRSRTATSPSSSDSSPSPVWRCSSATSSPTSASPPSTRASGSINPHAACSTPSPCSASRASAGIAPAGGPCSACWPCRCSPCSARCSWANAPRSQGRRRHALSRSSPATSPDASLASRSRANPITACSPKSWSAMVVAG
jgi:ABC-type dipeptide/oligopeptide/nickel transport system permease component